MVFIVNMMQAQPTWCFSVPAITTLDLNCYLGHNVIIGKLWIDQVILL